MDFLAFVRSLAKRDAPSTPAELRRALTEAEAAATEGQARCAELAAKRAETLLDGDDKTLDRIERELQLSQRDADRADLAAATLRERIADAEDRERQAVLDAAYDNGMKAFARSVELIRDEYPPIALQLVALLNQLGEQLAIIDASNATLDRANDTRAIGDPDMVARPRSNHAFLPIAFAGMIRLPSAEDATRMLWPTTTDANGINDFKPRPAR